MSGVANKDKGANPADARFKFETAQKEAQETAQTSVFPAQPDSNLNPKVEGPDLFKGLGRSRRRKHKKTAKKTAKGGRRHRRR